MRRWQVSYLPGVNSHPQQINYSIQIRITSAKEMRKPVSTARHKAVPINPYFKLPRLAVDNIGGNTETILN
jgi:hypothetical protein